MNRAGVGLIELVSEPEITSPKETSLFVQRIHELFQDLKICSGNLEQGAMRIDVNVNLINEETGSPVTPRVELKNINGIGIIEDAVRAELERQLQSLEEHRELKQETRLYSSETNETILLRTKDTSESYRYLPEYDLPAFHINDFVSFKEDLPLTRHEKIQNYIKSYPHLQGSDLLRLWTRPETLPFLFEQCLPLVTDQRFLLNWCVGELLAILNRENLEAANFTPQAFAKLVENVKNGELDKELAKTEMISALKEARDLDISKYTNQITDDEISDLINREIDLLFASNSDRVAFLKSSEGQKRGSVDFFIGPLMKQFRGKITAVELSKLLKERLK